MDWGGRKGLRPQRKREVQTRIKGSPGGSTTVTASKDKPVIYGRTNSLAGCVNTFPKTIVCQFEEKSSSCGQGKKRGGKAAGRRTSEVPLAAAGTGGIGSGRECSALVPAGRNRSSSLFSLGKKAGDRMGKGAKKKT